MNRLTDRRLRAEIYKWEGRVCVRKCQLLKAERKLKQIRLRHRVATVGLMALSEEQASPVMVAQLMSTPSPPSGRTSGE